MAEENGAILYRSRHSVCDSLDAHTQLEIGWPNWNPTSLNASFVRFACMVSTRYLTYSRDWAEAWNLMIPRSQTVRETDFLVWAFREFARISVHRVLDAGCGTGRIALELAGRGYDVTGIDKYGSMVRVAKRNARRAGLGVRFSRGSLEAPGLGGGMTLYTVS